MIMNKEYYTNYSLVMLVWSLPDNQSQPQRINYYQVLAMVKNEESKFNTSFMYNSTLTMAILPLPYNSNITLFLTAHNCVGESQAVTVIYNPSKHWFQISSI